MGYQGNVLVESRIKVVADALKIATECVDFFMQADQEQRISFDHEIVPTAFEIIGRIFSRASALSDQQRDLFLAHIRDQGPTICLEIITSAQRRSPPVVHRHELVEMLIKETLGYP
jgi:hypothetical protein